MAELSMIKAGDANASKEVNHNGGHHGEPTHANYEHEETRKVYCHVGESELQKPSEVWSVVVHHRGCNQWASSGNALGLSQQHY